VGETMGATIGESVGETMGATIGESVGETMGNFVGETIGESVRGSIGESIGAVVMGEVIGRKVGIVVGGIECVAVGIIVGVVVGVLMLSVLLAQNWGMPSGYLFPFSSQQLRRLSSIGQFTSSYSTGELSHLREKKFSHPARSTGSLNRLQLQFSSGSAESINHLPHAANPDDSAASRSAQVLAKLYSVTSKPGAEISKCGLLCEHMTLPGGQKFVPFNTRVVSTPSYPGALLVPVTFQHFPHPSASQLPPPSPWEMAAVP